VLTVTGAGQLAIPLKLSVQVKVTVTLLLFQPAALGAGVAVAVMAGAVLSRFTVTAALVVMLKVNVVRPVPYYSFIYMLTLE